MTAATHRGPASRRRPAQVRRRDGTLVAFDVSRIESAVSRAAREVACEDPDMPATVAADVADALGPGIAPVETIQEQVQARLGRPDSATSPAPTSSTGNAMPKSVRPKLFSKFATN